MDNNFKCVFNQFVNQRTEVIASIVLPLNRNYRKTKAECDKIMEQIGDNLAEHSKMLPSKYEEALAELQNINDDVIYMQGLKDGIALARILDIDKELVLDDNPQSI